jgi:hypothetical protein
MQNKAFSCVAENSVDQTWQDATREFVSDHYHDIMDRKKKEGIYFNNKQKIVLKKITNVTNFKKKLFFYFKYICDVSLSLI